MDYSSDFKLKLCKLVCDEGIPVSKVAEDHNIERRTLQAWLQALYMDLFNNEIVAYNKSPWDMGYLHEMVGSIVVG